MPIGTVKFFNQEKGYGFIQRQGKDDIFVHISGVADGQPLQDGQEVQFEEAQGRKGPEAQNVR